MERGIQLGEGMRKIVLCAPRNVTNATSSESPNNDSATLPTTIRLTTWALPEAT